MTTREISTSSHRDEQPKPMSQSSCNKARWVRRCAMSDLSIRHAGTLSCKNKNEGAKELCRGCLERAWVGELVVVSDGDAMNRGDPGDLWDLWHCFGESRPWKDKMQRAMANVGRGVKIV